MLVPIRASAAVLDSAALLADDRVTASLSKDGLRARLERSARPYQARRTERLFIPYFAILAYARSRPMEDAAVRLGALSNLLAQYANDCSEAERATHSTLHYIAGVAFERAGEGDEARVAYRNARALLRNGADSLARIAPLRREMSSSS